MSSTNNGGGGPAYRGDLDAVNARIATLEEELSKLPPLPRRIGTYIVAVAILGVGALLSARLVLTTGRVEPHPISTTPWVPPPDGVVAEPGTGATLRVAGGVHGPTPLIVDVNNDGVEDLVVPMTSHRMIVYASGGRGETHMHLVAFDGTTFSRRWHVGGWTSSGERAVIARGPSAPAQLVKASGGFAVFADSKVLHAIDLSNGKEQDATSLNAPIVSLCETTDGRVNVITSRDPAPTADAGGDGATARSQRELEERTFSFGVEKSKNAISSGGQCILNRGMPLCVRGVAGYEPASQKYPCIAPNAYHETPRMSGVVAYEESDMVLRLGDATTTSGGGGHAPSNERPLPYAEARVNDRTDTPFLSPNFDKLIWEKPLALPNDHPSPLPIRHCYADRRLFVAYSDRSSSLKITAHDAKTGKLLWSHAIDRAQIASLQCTASRVYATTSEALHVYDALPGTQLHTFVSETIEATNTP